ncbi:hypothetical protein L596_025567 [Steinernema carpocapsae]|uniref:Uncharacterized protein n=1 Tax=Steinernema carpocapsae TaxID=34508 RepID=A0A4U5M8Y9_STECR|nr:hypothetical protein L596_025567 [Steinernema carpocapsae]
MQYKELDTKYVELNHQNLQDCDVKMQKAANGQTPHYTLLGEFTSFRFIDDAPDYLLNIYQILRTSPHVSF